MSNVVVSSVINSYGGFVLYEDCARCVEANRYILEEIIIT
jgi:hypothetical protein